MASFENLDFRKNNFTEQDNDSVESDNNPVIDDNKENKNNIDNDIDSNPVLLDEDYESFIDSLILESEEESSEDMLKNHFQKENCFSEERTIPSSTDFARREKETAQKKIQKKGIDLLAVILGFSIGMGSVFAVSSIFRKKNAGSEIGVQTISVNNSANGKSAIVDAVKDIMPCVVSINATIPTVDFFGIYAEKEQNAASGFIVAKENGKLYIATNNHVVDNSEDIRITFIDSTGVNAKIIGVDSSSDIALLSIDISEIPKATQEKIKVAVLGDSDSINVGQEVIAVGNALGYGQSVTSGVVSAKNREIPFSTGTMTLIQTDAAINPGNSGGVLVDVNSGVVIGINNSKLASAAIEGIGYAIPINTVKPVIEELKNDGVVDEGNKGYLGINGKTINTQYSEAFGFPEGVLVAKVIKDSPAEKAGIIAGDIITEFAGQKVSTMNGLQEKIRRKHGKEKVSILLQRSDKNGNYKEVKVEATLGALIDYQKTEENKKIHEDEKKLNPDDSYKRNEESTENSDSSIFDYFNGNYNEGHESEEDKYWNDIFTP